MNSYFNSYQLTRQVFPEVGRVYLIGFPESGPYATTQILEGGAPEKVSVYQFPAG